MRASNLKQKEPWPGWKQLTIDDELRGLVESAPARSHNSNNTFSDPTNLMFLGDRKQLEAAFAEAGWFQADNLGVKSALKVAQATVRQTGYSSAPVSTLLLEGRPPDLVFQKSLNTFAQRHHLRVWKLEKTYNGQPVWIAAGTHDIATSKSGGGSKWSHRIDPHIDRERDWIETDLLYAGTAIAYVEIARPNAPRKINNATGDEILTDGKVSVLQLAGSKGTGPS